MNNTYGEKILNIDQYIKQNGIRAITGPILNIVLKYILDPNAATIDTVFEGETLLGNVWTKEQSDLLFLKISEYTRNGLIRADKIESSAVSIIVPIEENTLTEFIANNANYTYEANDFIAIPNSDQSQYALYAYIGGSKTVVGNYLPTGLTTVTIPQVQGLQDLLDLLAARITAVELAVIQVQNNLNNEIVERAIQDGLKLNKPLTDGLFNVKKDGENFTFPPAATKTSSLENDGEDGVHPFITAKDLIPIQYPNTTQHGLITTTSNSVTIGLSELGENFALISGIKYIEPTTNPETPKPFTAVSQGKLKVVIIQALPDDIVFHLAEGVEGEEAIDPDYNGLLVKRIIVSDSGQTIEGDLDAFQLKANEGWVDLLLNDTGATIQTVSVHHAALRFNIISTATNIKIGGFRFYATKFLYDGVQVTLRNQTAGNLEITTIAGANIYSINTSGDIIKLKPFESITLAYHLLNNLFYALKSSGGGASFPELGNDGDVLVKSGTNALWSSIIKGVELLGNAWLKLKLISFQGYTIAQKNAIASPQEGMLIYQNESPKGFQKYEGGSWNPIGSNISNTDLSNVSARTFLQAADFTWNTVGLKYYLKNLIDKSGDTTYSKMLVVHPTTGEVVTKTFGDKSLTLIHKYVHNTNTVILPSAIDYANSYITVTAHGLIGGLKVCGIFKRGIDATASNPGTDLTAAIPEEYMATQTYIKIIDADTLQICNAAGVGIIVNTANGLNSSINVAGWQAVISGK